MDGWRAGWWDVGRGMDGRMNGLLDRKMVGGMDGEMCE